MSKTKKLATYTKLPPDPAKIAAARERQQEKKRRGFVGLRKKPTTKQPKPFAYIKKQLAFHVAKRTKKGIKSEDLYLYIIQTANGLCLGTSLEKKLAGEHMQAVNAVAESWHAERCAACEADEEIKCRKAAHMIMKINDDASGPGDEDSYPTLQEVEKEAANLGVTRSVARKLFKATKLLRGLKPKQIEKPVTKRARRT